MNTHAKVAISFGVAFVIVLLIIAINFPKPSEFQFPVFRIVLALAVAGAATRFLGFLRARFGNGSQACGVLAVFAVLHLVNPAELIADSRQQSLMTRVVSESAGILSANRLYREFKANPIDATDKYYGKTVALEGLIGEIILLDNEVALHIPDYGKSTALIVAFPRRGDLRGFRVGDKIQLQCAFDKYEYGTVWMSFCTLAPPRTTGPKPVIVASNVPSANLLYREYIANEDAASAQYDGTIVELEARRGNQIQMDDGSIVIHIADKGSKNALIATFPDASEVAGIGQGDLFRFRCQVRKFEYYKLWLEPCQIE